MSPITPNPPPQVPEAGLTPPQEVTETTPNGELDLRPWQVLQTWRAQSFDGPVLERDPFAMDVVVTGQSSQSGGDAPVEMTTTPPSPEDLGINFTGIVIAGRDRVAILENEPVHAGSTLKVERDGRSYFVKILDITPTSIKLNIDGVDFEQSLPNLGLNNGAGKRP